MPRLRLLETLNHIRHELLECIDDEAALALRRRLNDAERNLALFDANFNGANLEQRRAGHRLDLPDKSLLSALEASPIAAMLIDPRAGLHIVAINTAYAQGTLTDPCKIAGERLFDVFPDNPDDPKANGVTSLYDSLRVAAITLRPDLMDLQRYDVRDANGRFVEKFWQCLNEPVLDDKGKLKFILHTAIEVPAPVLLRQAA